MLNRDRYYRQRKTTRNGMLIEFMKLNPRATFSEAGEIFHISRQRARVICITYWCCSQCYHHLDNGLCSCREIGDVINQFCPDWFPK